MHVGEHRLALGLCRNPITEIKVISEISADSVSVISVFVISGVGIRDTVVVLILNHAGGINKADIVRFVVHAQRLQAYEGW